MITKKRTEIIFMTLTVLFVLVGSAMAEGEWATNGNNIHNTNSGNVGIGITSPQARQHNQIEARSTAFDAANGGTWHDLIIQNPNNTQNAAVGLAFELNRTYHTNAGIGIAAVKNITSDDYGADMIFVTRPHRAVAKERIRITSDGNVGIGTTNPAAELEIRADTSFIRDGQIILDPGVEASSEAGPNVPNWIRSERHANTSWDLGLGGSSYNGGKPLVMIKNNGNVGIGTTDPVAELEIRADTSFIRDGQIILDPGVEASSEAGPNVPNWIRSERHANTSWDLGLGGSSYNGGKPLVMIKNNGNVGIGIPNPQTKLSVNGTITAKEIKVESGWSDFVFEETYELPSLNSVESYIKKHKHLPDIPSAKEVDHQGLAISEILAKQMQKIEELTLYLINIKKENDLLKATLTKQNKQLSELKELRERIEALELKN